MPKTTSFADCRRFAANVAAAGGKLPGPLKNLLAAHSVLAASTALPAAAVAAPESAIVDCALDGSLTEEKLAELLPAAASAAAVREYAKQLAVSTENILLAQFHRELGNGAADLILDSMRPQFDKATKEIQKARGLFNAESSAEHVLASGEPAVIEAWQGLDEHLKIVGKVVMVARHFGCRPVAQFPQLAEYPLGDNHQLADEALFCADGDLARDSAAFLTPDRPHRGSAIFKVSSLRLHTVASATARYNSWAAQQYDDKVANTPVQSYVVGDKLVPIPHPPNPFRENAAAS